jgi:hypothetical protein
VGGGDDADIDLADGGLADALDLAAVEDAQELGLEVEGELADLVEEEGAAVGLLEAAGAVGHGAGEGAFFVAEDGGLGELAGEGAAVEDDEGALGARGLVVEGAGDQLLAGAGLAADEHAHVGGGDALEHGVDLAHGGAAAEQAPKWSRPESGTWTSSSARKAIAVLPSRIGHAGLDPGLLDADAVDEAAVGAAEVAQEHAGGADEELGVQAGDRGVGEDEVVDGAAADGEAGRVRAGRRG